MKKIKSTSPETIVIMITAYASADTAIKAMKEGAYDYITKPFKVDEIKLIIKNALEKKHLQKENVLLEAGRPRPLCVRQHHRSKSKDARPL